MEPERVMEKSKGSTEHDLKNSGLGEEILALSHRKWEETPGPLKGMRRRPHCPHMEETPGPLIGMQRRPHCPHIERGKRHLVLL